MINGKKVLKHDSLLFLSKRGKGWRFLSFNEKHYKSKAGEPKSALVCASLENLVRDIIKSEGIQGGSSHSGRRTLATLMYRKGYDLEFIQRILDHATHDMTLEYIEPDMKHVEEVFSKTLKGIKVPASHLNKDCSL